VKYVDRFKEVYRLFRAMLLSIGVSNNKTIEQSQKELKMRLRLLRS